MQKKVNANASRQKAAKKMYVPHEIVLSMSGVIRPMTLPTGGEYVSVQWAITKTRYQTHKLHIHVADVVIEIALDRMERLNISDGRTQPMGAFGLSTGTRGHNIDKDLPNEYEKLMS